MAHRIRGWELKRIDMCPGKPATVTLAQGSETVSFRTRRFGVGRRGRKTAALAKFVAKSGFGDATNLFHSLASLWPDYCGPLPVEGLDISINSRHLKATA